MKPNQQKTLQLRYQIRRKYIEQIFQKKRLQYLQPTTNLPNHQYTSKQQIAQNIAKLTAEYIANNNKLQLPQLKTLVMMSQNPEILIHLKTAQFIQSLEIYLNQQYRNTQAQYYATFILGNLFYAIEKEELSISENFMLRVFETLLVGHVKIQENCLLVIFHVVVTLGEGDLERMVNNYRSDYNVVHVMYRMVQECKLPERLVREILKIFFMLARRLKYPRYQQFAKMRKLIILTITTSQNPQLIYFGLLCLSTLMICLPQQCNFSNKNKTNILVSSIQYSQSQQCSPKMQVFITKQILKILNLSQKSLLPQFIMETALPFLYKTLEQYKKQQSISINPQLCYSFIYTLLQQRKISLDQFLDNFNGLFLLLVQSFRQDNHNMATITQLIYLLGLIYGKGYYQFQKNQTLSHYHQLLKQRFEQLLQKNVYNLQTNLYCFIEETLNICSEDVDL